MPTYKLRFSSPEEQDGPAVAALLQLIAERFKGELTFERLLDEGETVQAIAHKRVKHKRVVKKPVNHVQGTTAAGEFLKMAKASASGRVSLFAYKNRLVSLKYADSTADVTINKLGRAGYIKVEGGFGVLLKEYEPFGIDSKLRRMIAAGEKAA